MDVEEVHDRPGKHDKLMNSFLAPGSPLMKIYFTLLRETLLRKNLLHESIFLQKLNPLKFFLHSKTYNLFIFIS